jgi:ectoine hydroxylase-related dioxygenase (phytanoyl-CoA dioxygenase family)
MDALRASVAGKATPQLRFQFDTCGYCIIRGALEPAHCAQMKAALDHLEAADEATAGTIFRNTTGVRGAGDGSRRAAFEDHQFVISSPTSFSTALHPLLDHEAVLPYLFEYMEAPAHKGDWTIRKEIGRRSSWWHRGNGPDGYRYDEGKIRTRHMNVAWMLDDQPAGSGCLLVVPGSHQHSCELSYDDYPGLSMPGSIELEGHAGDCVIFSESLLHCGDEKRRGPSRRNVYSVWDDLADPVIAARDMAVEGLERPIDALWGSLSPRQQLLCREPCEAIAQMQAARAAAPSVNTAVVPVPRLEIDSYDW